jgi:hypothetical protein
MWKVRAVRLITVLLDSTKAVRFRLALITSEEATMKLKQRDFANVIEMAEAA